MRFLKLFIYFAIIFYVSGKQQLYSSASQYKSPDKRVVTLQNYLSAKKSPLASVSNAFIRIADKYGLDWKLLPAIAGVESGFEKAGNLNDFNPFGIFCGKSLCSFKNYNEAITYAGKLIGTSNYYSKFRETKSIQELAVHYNNGEKAWIDSMNYFIDKLDAIR